MKSETVKIFPLGDAALTVCFGSEISPEFNKKVLNLARYFEENQFQGFVEIVPAYASLTIFYDVLTVRKKIPAFATAFEAVKNLAEKALPDLNNLEKKESRLVKIPFSYKQEFAPDLGSVASINNLSPEKVIEVFTAQTYRVYMLGFLPAFAYMGEVSEQIAAPRKSSPRAEVAKGSVGIAGRQTGIYSLASPGGWQLIGRTNVELFTPYEETPTFLQAGDRVQFYVSDF